jgi:hypothetical protein
VLQKAEESSRQYKKWLQALANYSRMLLGAHAAVEAAKEELKGREEDISLFLDQADTFLLARDKSRRRRHKDKEGCAAAATAAALSPLPPTSNACSLPA